MNSDTRIGIIGLGYVGLPLALEFSHHYKVRGFDINDKKIEVLKSGRDPNNEVEDFNIDAQRLSFHSNIKELEDCNVYIVGVPTPITSLKTPDLRPLKSASQSVGSILKEGDYVIYESTVYPGCTEEVCIPILEQESSLIFKKDFKVGYSPERINPGDKVHTLTNTIKIVSGCDNKSTAFIKELYQSIVKPGVYITNSIKVAEAAKIIENTQRDLNIALMNELSIIFDLVGINSLDVINAAASKWNFIKFTPGLVGGHCISVDPYYLTYKSKELGYNPEIILAGRKVNDNLSKHIVNKVLSFLNPKRQIQIQPKVLVLGITFKEDVSDIRNSKTVEVVKELIDQNVRVDIFDPNVNLFDLKSEYGLTTINEIGNGYDCVIVAVPHQEFKEFDEQFFKKIMNEKPLIIDIKNTYKNKINNITYWAL